VKDTPIAESVILGAGIGAAIAGLKPMVELMTINFSLLAIDQIVNNAAKLRYMSNDQVSVPLVVRMAAAPAASSARSIRRASRAGTPTSPASRSSHPRHPTTPRVCSCPPSSPPIP